MEWLRGSYTEVWVSSAVVPLVAFADRVRAIADTGIDLVGIGIEAPSYIRNALCAFDEIVSWYGSNRPEFREAALELHPNWRFLRALPPTEYAQHVTDFHAQQAGAPMNLQASVPVSIKQLRDTAVIHPFSGGRAKNWPLSRFEQLAREVGIHVEWTAGPEEELAGARRFENLRELADWIAGASVYIGNDSGITHLAAATGMPTVALFGATDAGVWAPRGANVTVVEGNGMEAISVDEVKRELSKLLDSSAAINSSGSIRKHV
jgi:heptosyltransferase-3